MTELKLTIELVPKTAWFQNLRDILPRKDWDLLRLGQYKAAGYKCEICGDGRTLECHETWEYDDVNHVQTLKGLIALCRPCHMVKHAGLSIYKGYKGTVLKQLNRVNGMTKDEAEEYLDFAFEQWQERSKHNWTLDTSVIGPLNKPS